MNRPFIANIIIGGALLFLGVITLLANLFNLDLNLRFWWPLFVLVPGIVMGLIYISSRQTKVNLLVPSIILTIYGLTFILNNVGNVYLGTSALWAATAFVYPGAVAVGMWALWSTQGKQIKHLVSASILTIISLLILCFTFFTTTLADVLGGQRNSGLIAPLLLICIGLVVIGLPTAASATVKKSWADMFKEQNSKSKYPEANKEKMSEVLEAEIVQDKE